MNDLESLLSRLVSIDSVNPSLVPGARGEAEIGDYVAEWMRGKGLEVERQELGARLRKSAPHPTLGTGSLHASLIAGGQELSSYPASCRLDIERRTIPGETPDAAEAEIRAVIDALAAREPGFKAVVKRTFARGAMEARKDSPIALAVARHSLRCLGMQPEFAGMSGWLDSALLDGAGIPTVVLGPVGAGLHGEEEWVDLVSVRKCRDIVLDTIGDYCA